jgi:hypothetical protein
MGWPAIGYFAKPAMDMSGWDAIQFWIRAETNLDRHMAIRFILHSDGKGRINQMIRSFRPGKWVQARFGLRELPHMDKVNLLHFFICENEYLHGDEMTFQIGGFELCNTKKEVTKLPPREAAVGLYVGERADKSDEVVMVQDAAAELPVLLVMETGQEAGLGTEDEVRYRFHEVFSGKESFVLQPLGKEVGRGSVGRVEQKIALEQVGLVPGYYLVPADVLRGGKSVLGGRVGSDDLYVKAPGESMCTSSMIKTLNLRLTGVKRALAIMFSLTLSTPVWEAASISKISKSLPTVNSKQESQLLQGSLSPSLRFSQFTDLASNRAVVVLPIPRGPVKR